MTIKELQDRAQANAIAKGFAGLNRTIGDQLMLVVTELGEALEEYRSGHAADEVYYNWGCGCHSHDAPAGPTCPSCKADRKPEGLPVEVADAVIRLAQFSEACGFDLQAAIALKMDYNDTRPILHGGKRL